MASYGKLRCCQIRYCICLRGEPKAIIYLLIKPFQKVENELNTIEHNVVSKNWNAVNSSLNKIDKLWIKYEILLRVLNRKDINDDFVLHLDQCKLLAKYKDDNMLEYLSILKDDVKDMMHVIPNP